MALSASGRSSVVATMAKPAWRAHARATSSKNTAITVSDSRGTRTPTVPVCWRRNPEA